MKKRLLLIAALNLSLISFSQLNFLTNTNYTTNSYPRNISCADFNGDSKSDIAVANYGNGSGNTVSIFLNSGSGSFGTKNDFVVGSGSHGITVGDLNNDGKQDIVTANRSAGSISILLGNGNGTFQTSTSISGFSTAQELIIADFNNDGKKDIAVPTMNNTAVVLGNGNGTFQTALTYNTGSGNNSISVGDLNSDGFKDIITSNNGSSNQIGILINKGDGTFNVPSFYTSDNGPSSVMIGDLNKDNKLDFIVGCGTKNINVFIGNGNGTFTKSTTYQCGGNQIWDLDLFDFNNDGNLDIVTANNDSNNFSILLGNGDASFLTAKNFPTANGCLSVACADFNSDNKLDVANVNYTSQNMSVSLNNSQPTLISTKVYVDAPATVNQNQEVEMSISTEALNTADNVIAYQTDLSYDPIRYTYVGSNLTGTLNPNGSVDINTSNNGLLKIGYMSQTALSGAGSLVKLKFKANNTLGQGVFGLSNFLYNTTTVTSLKSDTVNTIDGIPPTAKITYSQNPVRKGDSLLITVKFNEKMAVSPVPQLNLSGQNTLPNTNLTKVDDTTYTYWWVVEKGNGAVNVNLVTGKDLGGNVIVATPTQNPSFTVLPTLFGDIDTNKLVQAYDAALALQYSVGLNPLPTMDPLPWSNWRIAVANVDTVGNITANDASLILQKSIGKIATFPADAKKRGGDAPVANVSVTQEGNQLVFRTTGTLYALNVFMKDNFNVLGQPDVKNKSAMLATNINATTYNVGLASTTPFAENEPFLVIPILTNENVQGTMDIVANSQERSLSYGRAAGITAINKEVVIVYPNPTKDIVTINNAQGNTLRIIDTQGKEVYNQKVTTSTMELSMKTLGSKGMYVLHIVDANNESVQTKQIVLE